MDGLSLDGGVLLFTTVISIGVALAFGLLPALHASRQDLRDNLQEGSGTTGSPYARRLLSGLVVVEVALALVLLVGAGLMTLSFTKLLQVSPGFDSTNLVAARVTVRIINFFEKIVNCVDQDFNGLDNRNSHFYHFHDLRRVNVACLFADGVNEYAVYVEFV